MQRATSETGRISAAWLSPTSFDVTTRFVDGQQHRAALPQPARGQPEQRDGVVLVVRLVVGGVEHQVERVADHLVDGSDVERALEVVAAFPG